MERKILLVEDDAHVRIPIREIMVGAGYRLVEAESVEMGIHLFRTQEPDLLILDRHLPDGSGLEVCAAVRKHASLSKTPVIMLTGAGKLEEKAEGFAAGADQYLVKPVDPKELVLWVDSLLRRMDMAEDPGAVIEAGELRIEVDAHMIRFKDRELADLTVKEFELFQFLVRNRPRPLSRQFILSKLWHTVAVDNLIDVYISKLRKKLPTELADRLQSVPGKGFRYLG